MKQRLAKYKDELFMLFFLPMAGCVALGMSAGDYIYKMLFFVAMISLLVKMAVTDYNIKEMIGIILVVLLVISVFFWNGERTLFLSVIAVVGMKDVNIKRILRHTLYIYVLGMIITIVLALTGLGRNGIHELPKAGEIYRIYDLGFGHPNGAYNHLLVAAMLVFIVYGEKLKITHYIILSLIMYIGYKVLLCRAGWIVYLIFLVSLCMGHLLRKKAYEVWMYCWCLVPLAAASGSLILTTLYEKNINIAVWVNRVVTGRLDIFADALSQVGVHVYAPADKFAFYVDNVYLYILLDYGTAVLVLYVAVYTISMFYLKRKREELPLLILGCLAIYGFMEYSLVNPTWNPMLLYLSVVFSAGKCFGNGESKSFSRLL